MPLTTLALSLAQEGGDPVTLFLLLRILFLETATNAEFSRKVWHDYQGLSAVIETARALVLQNPSGNPQLCTTLTEVLKLCFVFWKGEQASGTATPDGDTLEKHYKELFPLLVTLTCAGNNRPHSPFYGVQVEAATLLVVAPEGLFGQFLRADDENFLSSLTNLLLKQLMISEPSEYLSFFWFLNRCLLSLLSTFFFFFLSFFSPSSFLQCRGECVPFGGLSHKDRRRK